MPALLALIPIKDWIYLGAIVGLLITGACVRQHFVNEGWDHALEKVKAQDTRAVDAAAAAQRTADQCYAAGHIWSTITGDCTQ